MFLKQKNDHNTSLWEYAQATSAA